jgi:hypothetical protein
MMVLTTLSATEVYIQLIRPARRRAFGFVAATWVLVAVVLAAATTCRYVYMKLAVLLPRPEPVK